MRTRSKIVNLALVGCLLIMMVGGIMGYTALTPKTSDAYTGTLRENFTTFAIQTAFTTTYWAETFLATGTYTFTEANIHVGNGGNTDGQVTMELRESTGTGNGSKPVGSILDTAVRDCSDLLDYGGSGAMQTWTFSGGITIMNGTTYSLVAYVSGVANPNVWWARTTTAFFPEYAGGVSSKSLDTGTTWTIWDSTSDFPFQVYGSTIPLTPIVSVSSSQTEGYNRGYYANGRYWIWYDSIFGISYVSTADSGITYTAPIDVTTRESECWQVWFNDTRVYYTKVDDTAKNKNIYWRFGICNADGSITWGIAESIIVAADASYYYKWVTPIVTSAGEVVVAYERLTTYSAFPIQATGSFMVTISTTATGAWATKGGYPLAIGTCVASNAKILSLIPTVSGKAYLAYTEDSITAKGCIYDSTFGTVEVITSSMVVRSWGGELKMAYDATTSSIMAVYLGSSLRWSLRSTTSWIDGGQLYNGYSSESSLSNGSLVVTTLVDGTMWCFWRESRSSANFFYNHFASTGYPPYYSSVSQFNGMTWDVPTTYTIGNAPNSTGTGGVLFGMQSGAPTLVQITDGKPVPWLLYAYFGLNTSGYHQPYLSWVFAEILIDNSTPTTATLVGKLFYRGFGESSATCGFKYGLDNTTISTSATTTCSTDDTEFSVTISGLTPNTRYYYQAFATNTYGTAYSSDLTGIVPDFYTTSLEESPRVIGGTIETALYGSRHSGLVYANGRYWAFTMLRNYFLDVGAVQQTDTNYAYTSSSDGMQWTSWWIFNRYLNLFSPSSPSFTTGDYRLDYFAYDETNNRIWGVGVAESKDVWVMSATPEVAGYLDNVYVKYGAVYISSVQVAPSSLSICVDPYGYPWISLTDMSSTKQFVSKSNTTDGTWTNAAGFPIEDTSSAGSAYVGDFLTRTSTGIAICSDNADGVAYVKTYNDITSSWSGMSYPFGATAVTVTSLASSPDGELYVAGCLPAGDRTLEVSTRDINGSWTYQPILNTTSGVNAYLCSGLYGAYVVWEGYPVAQHYYYSSYESGIWDTYVDWMDMSDIVSYEDAGSYGIHLDVQRESIGNALFMVCFPSYTVGWLNSMRMISIVEAPVDCTISITGLGTLQLAWTVGFGDVNSMVRYTTSHYPISITDGTLAYFGDDTFCTMETTPGTTYYFSVWGEGASYYSDSYSTSIITTSAASSPSSDGSVTIDTTSPTSTILDSSPIGGLISFVSVYTQLPRGTVGLLGFGAVMMFLLMAVAIHNKSVAFTVILAVGGLAIGRSLGLISIIFLVCAVIVGVAIGHLRGGQPTGG